MPSSRRTYRITTFGCRVNHAEQREMESILQSRGLQPAASTEPAALEVIHTCSVTTRAAAKSRQAIRRSRRATREGVPRVLVTGCLVASDPATVSSLKEDTVALAHQKTGERPLMERFVREVDRWLGQLSTPYPTDQSPGTVVPLPIVQMPVSQARHTRAEIRIQDGCDAHCTFCIIPHLRPTLRSKRLADVVAEARSLVDHGHREIVLTGIFIGAYGQPTARRRHQVASGHPVLADLVDAVAQVPGVQRLRISSMEPMDVTDHLLDAMACHSDIVVPHLHLPLQSGSDRILRRMNRQYRVGEYLDMIDRITLALTRDDLPPAITTDIICGFPGETTADFQATVAVVERVQYLHLHVFPYSPRPGTAAARWEPQFVHDHEKKTRVRTLMAMENDPDHGLAVRFRRRLVGRTLRAIIEQPASTNRLPSSDQLWQGRCDHYEMLTIRGAASPGEVVQVRVDGLEGDRTFATIKPETRRYALPVLSLTPAPENHP